ncbi:hypothetical protein [Paracidovorax cattleyae]|uniref:Uncharacterized protein n=1 Tax=Paracidovorax cattleyae TaxID=80868 RepID=A0A1H0RGT1_9BURK|nr:hypothetical protein [Paracidovorax cattleyae]SDP28763.1 hypothetical protein SAMN04489708_11060 [Paracidovorax cattleyae]
MTKPYRWGDVAPPAVQEMQKRRRYRASEFFARLKRGRGEKFDQERSAAEQPGRDGIAETVHAALRSGLTLEQLSAPSPAACNPGNAVLPDTMLLEVRAIRQQAADISRLLMRWGDEGLPATAEYP